MITINTLFPHYLKAPNFKEQTSREKIINTDLKKQALKIINKHGNIHSLERLGFFTLVIMAE